MNKWAFGLVLAAGAAPALAVDCSSFPNNTITSFVNEDVYAHDYTCTVARTGYVNGNLYQSGLGNLVIRGRVNGSIEETGAGSISLLAGSRVNGEIAEYDGGNVLVRGGATLGGDVKEYGSGSITVNVDLPGLINGNLYEHDKGSVFVRTVAGDFNGNVYETGAGNIEVTVASGTVFNGGIEEQRVGDVIVYVDGRFEGNLTELGDGDLSTAGNGTVNGNSEHQLPGRCTNRVANFEGAVCNRL